MLWTEVASALEVFQGKVYLANGLTHSPVETFVCFYEIFENNWRMMHAFLGPYAPTPLPLYFHFSLKSTFASSLWWVSGFGMHEPTSKPTLESELQAAACGQK